MLAVVGVYLMELQWAHTYIRMKYFPFHCAHGYTLGEQFWSSELITTLAQWGADLQIIQLGFCVICVCGVRAREEIENGICCRQCLFRLTGQIHLFVTKQYVIFKKN
jgi:hypothetical protein